MEDIFGEILKVFHNFDSKYVDPTSLCAIVSTCKILNTLATKVLYSRLILQSGGQASRFGFQNINYFKLAKTLSRSPILGSFIQELDLLLYDLEYEDYQTLSADILKYCTNLRTLNLSSCWTRWFTGIPLEKLLSLKLHIYGDDDNFDEADSAEFFIRLSEKAKLQTINIDNCYQDLAFEINQVFSNCPLKSIIVISKNFDDMDILLSHLVSNKLLHKTLSNLHIETFGDFSSTSFLSEFLPPLPNLEIFKLYGSFISPTQVITTLHKHQPRLTDFAIATNSGDIGLDEYELARKLLPKGCRIDGVNMETPSLKDRRRADTNLRMFQAM